MQATLQVALAYSTAELAVLVVVQVHSAGQVQASTPALDPTPALELAPEQGQAS